MGEARIDIEKQNGGLTLHPRGRLDHSSAARLWQESKRKINEARGTALTVNLGDVSGIDTSGVAYLDSVQDLCQEKGLTCEESNAPENIKEFLHYTRENSNGQAPDDERPLPPGFITALGQKIQIYFGEVRDTIDLFGQLLLSSLGLIRRPGRIRFHEYLYQLQVTGVGAVPLIAALSLLLGALMVFQSSASAKNIGANILVANMVVLAVTREMAPLVVAVALAGRSGSAFAAEIGTMKVNQELDAMTVMNLDVIPLIVLPRVVALALAEPVLTMIADAVGIIGGLAAAKIHLGVPVLAFLNEARGVLKASDLLTGLVKAFTSGAVTGFIGCASGFRTGTESGSVGLQTTEAVVKGIFAVILIDTIYSYIFLVFGL